MLRSIQMLSPWLCAVATCGDAVDQDGSIVRFNLTNPERTFSEKVLAKFGRGPSAPEIFRRFLIEKKITHLLVHYAEMALATEVSWKDLGIKVFVFCHGKDVHHDARTESFPFHRVHREDYPERLKSLSSEVRFFANSTHTKKCLLGFGIQDSKISVLHQGVEPNFRSRERIASERCQFLFLGRMVDFKGPDLVVRAFLRAIESGLHEAKLVMAGDGPLMTTCRLLVAESPYGDQVHFTGYVDQKEAIRLLNESDVFVSAHRRGPLSNRVEAYGVAVLEAMAAALPVIAGDSGGVVDTVVDQQTGFLLPPGDEPALREAMKLLSEDLQMRKRMGEAGRKRVEGQFSFEVQKRNMVRLMHLNGGEKT